LAALTAQPLPSGRDYSTRHSAMQPNNTYTYQSRRRPPKNYSRGSFCRRETAPEFPSRKKIDCADSRKKRLSNQGIAPGATGQHLWA
jgi:hypothetical protein